jgi:hypothetical protein
MNTKNTYITKTFVAEESFSELDFELQDKFGFNYEDDNDFIVIRNGQGNTDEAFPVEIDVLISTLQAMKEKGATHAEIEHHGDHIGYDISGYDIRKSTDEEIKVHEDKSIKRAEKEKKLNELYAQIRKIENENE